jgi:predicted transposase/invertase (TIGR01784 family)
MNKNRRTAALSQALRNAAGPIRYTLTNDYMFRAFLQKNQHVLKQLICSLLHLDLNAVKSLRITNPIQLGKTIDNKDFVLDINIRMNNNTFINLEMQVNNEYNWPERSLSYLCRSFDQLRTSEEYANAGPAIHIGFLDFTPFPEHPEFYASYKLLNVKTHYLYTGKFVLNVVSLKHIDLATDEDKQFGIDRWARLFKSTTWEDIKMLAKNEPIFQDAAETLYDLNADETIRAQCRAREDYNRQQSAIKYRFKELNTELKKVTSELQKVSSEKQQLASEKQQLASEKQQLIIDAEFYKRLLDEHGIKYDTADKSK